MEFIKNFARKHPKATKWIREGGLFIIFSYVVTFLKYIMLQFMPAMFSGYADIGWGWPSADVSLFGIKFVWNAIGYSVEQGGLAYLLAYLISSFLGECVNFPLQRNFTFRSHGKIVPQIAGYFLAWVVITIIENSINCVWVAVASQLVPDFIYNDNVLVDELSAGFVQPVPEKK